MSETTLSALFSTFKVSAEVFHNGQYCGSWSIDTSGTQYLSFHLVTHGQCYLMVNGNIGQTQLLKRGDLVLFPHDAKHQLSNEPTFLSEVNTSKSINYQGGVKVDATGLVCGYFSHQHPLIKQMTEYLPESIVISADEVGTSTLASIVQLLVNESLAEEKGATFVLERLSECVLALLFREHLDMEQGLFAALSHQKLNSAISTIINQPEAKWDLENLAKLSHMSRTSFSELFKSVVGTSVMEFVTQWRISVAYRLLKDEGIPTLAAAQQVGYENESSFSKAFKRVLGKTPGSVRCS